MKKPTPQAKAKENVLSRREIEGMIAKDKHIIILDGKVLQLDCWIKFHPGGPLAIKHMIGRDATDEVNAYVISLNSISCFGSLPIY